LLLTIRSDCTVLARLALATGVTVSTGITPFTPLAAMLMARITAVPLPVPLAIAAGVTPLVALSLARMFPMPVISTRLAGAMRLMGVETIAELLCSVRVLILVDRCAACHLGILLLQISLGGCNDTKIMLRVLEVILSLNNVPRSLRIPTERQILFRDM